MQTGDNRIDNDMKIETGEKIRWSSDTNWTIAHGSLESSITVESSDYPISEPDPDPASISPLVLSPTGPDAGSCEIKVRFEQKYDICQIYVRSSARVYEVYCAKSPQNSSEYLCTVRCGIAERDDKVLQTTCIEDVTEDHGECSKGGPAEETVPDGGNTASSEDEWVKVPQVQRNASSDKVSINSVENVQDLYEATAQISDADPCSLLTIRLLSLQDKNHVFVDEVYVFVDPVESTDSGNEALMKGSSAQSSLMAMFVPTLLQIAKSGANRVPDKHAYDEVLKYDKVETGYKKIDEMNVGLKKNQEVDQQYQKSKELDKDTTENVGLENNQVHQQNGKSRELDKDTTDSVELLQPTLIDTNKCIKPIHMNDLQPGHLERALEQLISRVSRVEDICLRFEEKMLKPIENMEARLQQVEHQLERLAKNSHYSGSSHGTRVSASEFTCSESNSSSLYDDRSAKNPQYSGLPHGTRISAPEFTCTVSNSSSLYNDQSDSTPTGASELEKKDLSCDHMSSLPGDANLHPSLLVTAPEFSCDEDEDNKDLKPSTPRLEPKKTFSVDDALAAALSGLLSTAKSHLIEHNQIAEERDESCQSKAQEHLAAENGDAESLQYTKVLTVKAPDFTADETCENEQSSSDSASILRNEQKGHDGKMVPPHIQTESISTASVSCNPDKDKSGYNFESASNAIHLNDSSELGTVDSFAEQSASCSHAETSVVSLPDLAKDSVENGTNQINDETTRGKTSSFDSNDEDIALEQVKEQESDSASDDVPRVYESSSTLLDFEFSILDVRFTSDVSGSTKSPLEALLDGADHDSVGDDGDSKQINVANIDGNEKTDLLPSNDLLGDLGVSSADVYSNSVDGYHNMCTPSSAAINVSLI